MRHPREQRGQFGRDGTLGGQVPVPVQQGTQPLPPLPDRRLLPGEIGVELFEHLGEIAPRVVREHVPHLGEPQPQLGQPPDPGEHDGVPQRVFPVAVGATLGLRQQPEMVVMPHRPRGDTDGDGEFSDPHALSRNVDAAARSSEKILGGMKTRAAACCTPDEATGEAAMGARREEARWTRATLGRDGPPLDLLTAHFDQHRYAPHAHDEFTIGVCVGGSEIIDYRGGRIHTGPGSIVVLAPGEMHTGGPAASDGYAYRALYAEPSLLTEGILGSPRTSGTPYSTTPNWPPPCAPPTPT